MSKRVYISADYSKNNGDCEVVETLNRWGKDNLHITDFVDTAKVVSGSVSDNPDCRICELKEEFNSQINISSAVIFVIGDKTSNRLAGSGCNRMQEKLCYCTPYKQNRNGLALCKVSSVYIPGPDENVGNINSYSYIRHEFEQARKKNKTIIVVYNSMRKEAKWLPVYMKEYERVAFPFWTLNSDGKRIGNYFEIKKALGYM